MNDDDLHSDHEMASAYLDGQASEHERALVDASPQLNEYVASFSALREHLADVPAAPVATRERALAAALAEFDVVMAAPAAATPSAGTSTVTRVDFRNTWRWRLLTGAAAAAVVGIIGVAVLDNNSNDSNSSTVAEANVDPVFDSPAEAGAPPAADKSAPRPTIGGIDNAAEMVLVVNSPTELLALPTPQVPGDTGDPVSSDPGIAAVETARTTDSDCVDADQVVLADIIYIDIPAIAVRDLATGVVQAIDPVTCAVITEVSP